MAEVDLSDRTRVCVEGIKHFELPLAAPGVNGTERLYQADVHLGSERPVRLVVGETIARRGFTPAAVLGGDFFQALLRGKENLFHELLNPDALRALRNISRTKKNTVLIIGHYGADRPRLETIRKVLGSIGYEGILAEDFPDIEEQDLAEKVVMLMSISRFVICDDVTPAGQNSELEIAKSLQPIVAVLRKGGAPTTMMQASIGHGVDFRKVFSYDSGDEFEAQVRSAAGWAENKVQERSAEWNRLFPWRNEQRVLR